MVETLETARSLSIAPHVLISAYMCAPNRGSEPGKSWRWVTHLAQHCRVSAITQSVHRSAIEAGLKQNPVPNLSFHYVSGPAWLRMVKYDQLRYHMNYLAWQRLAFERAGRLRASDPYDLVHHICFASITRPIFMQHLPVPLIFGPVGGGELGHKSFRDGGGLGASAYEWLRTNRMRMLRWDPLVQSTLRGAARIFVTTPENRAFVPPAYHHKLMIASSTGIESTLTRQPAHGSATGGHLQRWPAAALEGLSPGDRGVCACRTALPACHADNNWRWPAARASPALDRAGRAGRACTDRALAAARRCAAYRSRERSVFVPQPA